MSLVTPLKLWSLLMMFGVRHLPLIIVENVETARWTHALPNPGKAFNENGLVNF